MNLLHKNLAMALVAAMFAATAPSSSADILINEVHWDPNTNPADATHEYIELRGMPCTPLTNHYLIFVEAENNETNTGGAGMIENIFNLNNFSLGPNGYLVLRQRVNANAVFADYTVNPKAADYRNTGTSAGFGSGAGSSIGASNITNQGVANGQIENGGWTAFLFRNDGDPVSNAPALNVDLDMGNDGLDNANGQAGWTVLDSISVLGEGPESEFGRGYGRMNFLFDITEDVPDFDPLEHIEPGANYQAIFWPELESEYVGRWGNSTGSLPADWHLSNLTEDSLAGFQNIGDFRVSAEPHQSTDPADWESSQGVTYGTVITNTVGGPNYPFDPISYPSPLAGDFDGDRDVDRDDLNLQWVPRFACGDLDGDDFLDWQRNLGMVSVPEAATAQSAVPEPATAALACLAACGLARIRLPCRPCPRRASRWYCTSPDVDALRLVAAQ